MLKSLYPKIKLTKQKRKTMLRKLLSLCGIIIPLMSFAQIGLAQVPFSTNAEFALLQDFETGAILYSKNPDERMYPASMTKMMTAYLIFEELKKGRISLTDNFTISRNAYSIGGSRMFLDRKSACRERVLRLV